MAIKRRASVPIIDYSEPEPKPSFPDLSNYVPKPKTPLPPPNLLGGNLSPSDVRGSANLIDADASVDHNVTDIVVALRTAPEDATNMDRKYHNRIKNRGTAITAFCVDCQGGSRKNVTECIQLECPLWSFRFGGDPRFTKGK